MQILGEGVVGRLQEFFSVTMESVLELKRKYVHLMPCTADTWLVSCCTRLLKSLLLETHREGTEQGKSHFLQVGRKFAQKGETK